MSAQLHDQQSLLDMLVKQQAQQASELRSVRDLAVHAVSSYSHWWRCSLVFTIWVPSCDSCRIASFSSSAGVTVLHVWTVPPLQVHVLRLRRTRRTLARRPPQ